jgi:hypothetical protein
MPRIKKVNGKKIWTSHDNFPSDCEHNTNEKIWKNYTEKDIEFGWQYCPKCGLQRFKIENNDSEENKN